MEQESNSPSPFWSFMKRLLMLPVVLVGIMVALVVAIVAAVVYFNRGNSASFNRNGKIDITPTTVQSLENIGEWEFLSISNEELIDTVRHGFFGDDELVRIYYGTLRIGIDTHDAKPGWIATNGDSIVMTLPPIKLLDDDFIDEAMTRSFFESGKWSQEDKAALYERAHEAMTRRCLNEKNMDSAEQNAAIQFANLMRSMGFENVRIRFSDHGKK